MGEYWYLWVVFAAMVVLCVFAWIKAGKALARREKRVKAETQRSEYEKKLCESYTVLSRDVMENAPFGELLDGLAIHVQEKINDEPDVNKAYLAQPKALRYGYSLRYFFTDSKEKLSTFFRKNGEPLLGDAVAGLREAGCEGVLEAVEKEYAVFDSDNEEASYDEKLIEKLDGDFAAALEKGNFQEKIRQYLLNNV